MAEIGATVHASAVLVGTRAVLIRGAAGAGKSKLALALIEAGRSGLLSFARLVGDDRVELGAAHGRLLVRPAPPLAGLIEVRRLGIRRLDHEGVAIVGLVVDLGAPAGERMPAAAAQEVALYGIKIPLISLPVGSDPMPAVLAHLLTTAAEV